MAYGRLLIYRLLAALIFVASSALAATAQVQGPTILLIDKDRVLRESDVAERLAAIESKARAALQAELNELRSAMEAEENEIADLRQRADKTEFDERVRDFNDRVQETRRSVQQKNEALQRQFVEARRSVAEALGPVMAAILQSSGAQLIVDSRSILAARPDADVTEEALRRFNEATAALYPLPEQ